MGKPQKRFIFFVGTTAELIKIFPVMREMARREIGYEIIASGQNAIEQNELFQIADLLPVKLQINSPPKKKSVAGLIVWFFITFIHGLRLLPSELRGTKKSETILIVHGDTVSTVMGAVLGKLFGLKVAHIEAGLRSHNFLQPFPEELDRFITSFFADYHFCPYASAVRNLEQRSGEKIDTKYNTNIDALAFARTLPHAEERQFGEAQAPYFIFILHRQENLLNDALVKSLIEILLGLADQLHCLFVTHELTEKRLREMGLYDKVTAHPKIHMEGRKAYSAFISILDRCEFTMTDGGGNQQECFYLGKPCLLLRELTEGEEGVGTNVCISNNDQAIIVDFVTNYHRFRFPEVQPVVRPSEIIVDTLTHVRN